MKKVLSILLFSCFSFAYAQTSNVNLNQQLSLMKKYFLEENYSEFAHFVYPKVIEKIGGLDKMILLTETSMQKMKNEGFEVLEINYSNPSDFITHGNEIQMTITQELIMNTPTGKTSAEYTLIGISNDNGKNWKFIDTSGKQKDLMLERYPNLSSEIDVKPIQRKFLD